MCAMRSPASLQEFILCQTTHTHTHSHLCGLCCAPLPADQKVLSSVVIGKRRENHKDMHSKQPRRVDNRAGSELTLLLLQVGPLFWLQRFVVLVPVA